VSPDSPPSPSSRRSPLAAIAGATFVWLFLSALIFFPIWTLVPRTRLPLILLIVFGPPFYAVGTLVAGRVVGQRLDVVAAPRQRTLVRIAIAVLVMAIGCAIVIWTAQFLRLLA
jgi:hypothetical protein